MKAAFALLLLTTPALGETETVLVTADPVQLLSTRPSEAATGLALAPQATPRGVTQVSETTLDRYGVGGLDDLTAITPSAYTGSFYGVEGAVNLRGTLAETYFRGFKRAENRGTYDTPLAGDVTILRGPPSPVMGAGKVGGLVDFEPAAAPNRITLTYGAYSKRNLAAEGSLPVAVAGAEGAVSLRGDIDDSFSFYRGLHPSHQSLDLDADLARGPWSLSASYLFYHADGQVQTPGWNRLTQNLIDNGTYITGRNTSLKDRDGNGRLTLDELGGNPYTFDPNFMPLAIAGGSDAAHRLDSGLGTTTLDPRTVYLAPGVDFSRTVTHTGFAELKRDLAGSDTLRLQLFADTLSNDRFVSYGYPASVRAQIGEARLRYDFDRVLGAVTAKSVIGASLRFVHAIDRQSFNSGVIALDRRDISQGAAANDIIDSPFNSDPSGSVGLGWENDVASNISDGGLFALSDLSLGRLHLLAGGRYDRYAARSRDDGVLAYEPASGAAKGGRFTGSASLSWQSDSGWMPYVTHAVASALETGQGGEIPTQLLATGGWLSDSTLDEAGLKFAAPGLEASLAFYRQNRTQLSEQNGVQVTGTRGEGAELEVRWLISDHFSATLAADLAHTFVRGDHSVTYIPARDVGITPENGFGGSYLTYDFAALKGSANYDDTLLPHAVASPYVTYTGDGWGASLGATYAGAARQTVPDPVVFPAHVTVNASAFVGRGAWRLALNLDNALDARFFTPDADSYANLGALPGMGRRWRIALSRGF